jgi:hypothetical protein
MNRISDLKGAGYLTSAVSVMLLAIPALKSAGEDSTLLACLIGGVLLSILGMTLRWRSHRLDQHDKDAEQRALGSRSPVRS